MAENSIEEGLTKRFDDVLQKHLLKHKEKLTFDHQELTKELKLKKKERADLGLKLYDAQVKAKRQHEILQDLARQIEQLSGNREELEKQLDSAKAALSKTQEAVEAEQRSISELFRQIDILNVEVFKMLSAKNYLQSNVKVLDQSNIKTASDRRDLESQKAHQEDCINHLTQITERLQEKIVTHDVHIANIILECESVKKAQSQAKMESEAIEFERKSVTKQLDGAVKSMSKRDETYTMLLENNSAQRKAIECSTNEKKMLEKSLFVAEDSNSELNFKLSHLEYAAKKILEQISECFAQKELISTSILELKCQIDRIEVAIAANTKTKMRKEKELDVQEKSIQTLISETQELGKALNEQLLNRNLTDVMSQKVLKQLESVQNVKVIKEQERVNLDREFLLWQLEMEEKQKDIAQLTNEIKEVETILKVDETDIKNIRAKLQQGTGALDKKVKLINELKWKLDSCAGNAMESTHSGIVESKMQILVKELEEKLGTVDELKHLWMKQQSSLMQLSQEKDKCLEECKTLENQLSVYRQRNGRMKGNLQVKADENKDLERKIENLYRQITNLNKSTNDEQAQEVIMMQETIAMEEELLKKLKDNENKLAGKAQILDQLKEEKQLLRENIQQTENDFKNWQQKLKEIKEKKAAVDAEYKEGQIHFLTERLHKMKVQYATLCQHRGLFSKELERTVNRWDTLLTKSGVMAVDSRSRDASIIRNGLRRKSETLKKKLMGLEMEVKSTDMLLKSLTDTRNENQDDIDHKIYMVKNLKGICESNANKLAISTSEKVKSFEELVLSQQQLRFYQEIRDNTYQPISRSEAVVKNEIEKSNQKTAQYINLLEEIGEELKKNKWTDSHILSKVEKLKWKLETVKNFVNVYP